MKVKEKHRYSLRLPKDSAGDGYYRYFQDIYEDAMVNMKLGRRTKAFRLLKLGSRQYAFLFRKGISLSPLIFDDCSLWLCVYYTRNNEPQKLTKILKRNFVYYNGNYYQLTTGDLAWRLVPNEELDPQYDFGMDIPEDTNMEAVLELINERRGVL